MLTDDLLYLLSASYMRDSGLGAADTALNEPGP